MSAAGAKLHMAVTGAAGFVGRAVCAELLARGHEVTALTRSADARTSGHLPEGVRERAVGDLAMPQGLAEALRGVSVVVHLAARVHRMREDASDPLAAHRAANRDLTLALAREAAAQGVRRLVFCSTVKVLGERTAPGRPFRDDDPPAPEDPYAVSKREAEEGLFAMDREGVIEAVAVRPTLVVGPGAGGNLARLAAAVARGLPLPLGLANNRRSLVSLPNLALALALAAEHEAAPGKAYLVRDDRDISTAELCRLLGEGMGRSARLLPVPPGLISFLARLAGKGAACGRLLGDLCVDDARIRAELGYTPLADLGESVRAMGRAFAAGGRS
ncbi:NAD-dependent epimerase/dehydratase [Alkalidesulfovibrio alkalitolerans DSM 16529]|uniref:NAD-dependent epimerase/dehydratase n=1 Tax=Alkalidesulfovibrio alkalitolerans DSM 16529 TaxID=1121439 RepID=S7TCY6_9BACT|nr:NAD-dependent epimerase/dehydratase family protein [Alkalidesulfovibrio alkalitolerans]EPR34521.1 NAD-dependent epimerase/dehydratase [Alkalidesulfovibrio alkalitolerans DSM 16529]